MSSSPNIAKLDINENHDIKNENMQLKKLELTESAPVYKYRKTPDSDQLKRMNLRYGENKAKFVMDFGNSMI